MLALLAVSVGAWQNVPVPHLPPIADRKQLPGLSLLTRDGHTKIYVKETADGLIITIKDLVREK